MRLALAIALGLAASPPVHAAGPDAVLRTLGLLGTWGENCSIDQSTFLIRFSIDSFGLARVTRGYPDVVRSAATIVAAEQTPGGEIVLTLAEGFALPARRVSLRREGAALQIWRSELLSGGPAMVADGRDAASGAPVPELHLCMSE